MKILKTALITGASGKIGSAIVKQFLLNGYFVVGQYSKGRDRIDSLIQELSTLGLEQMFFPIACDFSNPKNIPPFCDKLLKELNHIDVLINNAGVDLYKLVTETTLQEWQNLLDVNVTSSFIITKALLPKMIERRYGKVIFISSVWGQVGASMESCYSASKSALIGFTKALAKEVGLSNITVNCVCPGVIDSPMNDRFSAQEKQELISACAINRLGNAEEVADLVYFLASSKADYITGQSIAIDGGFAL